MNDLAEQMERTVEAMAIAGAARSWGDLRLAAGLEVAWAECSPETRERWRGVARAMLAAFARETMAERQAAREPEAPHEP